MMLIVHLVSWVWLILMVTAGLTRHSIKAANRYLILSRLGYLLIIISGVYLSTKTFSGAWLLTTLKAILGIGTIGLIEVAFARKQESRLAPQLLALMIGGLILTTICGFSLHYLLMGQWF